MEVNQDAKAAEIFPQLAESIPLNYAIAVDAVKVVKDKLGKVLDPLPPAVPSGVSLLPRQGARTQVTALDFAPAVTERITKTL